MNYCNLAQHFLIKNCQKNSTPRRITLREVDFLNFEFEYLSENEFLCKTIFARTRGYISLVQWHYFKNCQWWHDALHNIFKNRRHILPIYLTVVSINYFTKNTVTTDGFQSYEENRRLLLLIYAVILKLSTFLGVYTILEINCSFFCYFWPFLNFLFILCFYCFFIGF